MADLKISWWLQQFVIPSPGSPDLQMQIVSRASASPWLSVCGCQSFLDPQVNAVRMALFWAMFPAGSTGLATFPLDASHVLPLWLLKCMGIVHTMQHHDTYHSFHAWDLRWHIIVGTCWGVVKRGVWRQHVWRSTKGNTWIHTEIIWNRLNQVPQFFAIARVWVWCAERP